MHQFPTNYLLDTNMITVLASRHTVAWKHMENIHSTDSVCTCFIVAGEWEYGILAAPGQQKKAQIRAAGAPIFDALTDIWESTPAIAQQYGVFHAQLRAIGQIIPTNDIWIAATAYVHNAMVVTTDPHFRRLAELSVVDWTQP